MSYKVMSDDIWVMSEHFFFTQTAPKGVFGWGENKEDGK